MLTNSAFWQLVLISVGGGWIVARVIQFFADGWSWKPVLVANPAARKRRRLEFLVAFAVGAGMVAICLAIAAHDALAG
ncbi:MAG TPA: hypothetical protein VGL22_03035 [Terracidiphilus sp.]|jgi:hypothetical protein